MSDRRSGAGAVVEDLQAVLADGLAALANASLDLDPASQARLAALEGYRVQVVADAPPPLGPLHLGLTVTAGRLRFHARALDRPNVIVRGAPMDLATWLATGQATASGGLTIDGDGTVLQELMNLVRGFRPDPGGPLERLLGPDLAARALGGVELMLAGLRSAAEAAGAAVGQGAARQFVDRQQLERFLDGVDDLRLRVDRLAARVSAREAREDERQP
jgi:ubiquinone biosynthesis accessory factor UbiJ